MRILFLSRWYPFPADNGSRIRVHNLLRSLAEHHEVSLVSFRSAGGACGDPRDYGVTLQDVQTLLWREFEPRSLRGRLGYLSPRPRSLYSTHSPEMAALIRRTARKRAYDLVIASEIQMAAYNACFSGVPALWEEIECGVHFQEYASASTVTGKLRANLTWAKHCKFVRETLGAFGRCTVVSDVERSLLHRVAPQFRSVDVVPNALRLQEYAGFRARVKPASLVFAGALTFRPNHEGVTWFLEKAYPIIQAAEPDVQVTLLGDDGGRGLPVRRNVIRAGWCQDVRPIIANSAVSIVPVLTGGGTRLKILESMALGTPVVSTGKGCEGLAFENGRHLSVADSPESFAAAVIRLLGCPDERQRLADAAQSQLRAVYDWNVVQDKFLECVERTASEGV